MEPQSRGGEEPPPQNDNEMFENLAEKEILNRNEDDTDQQEKQGEKAREVHSATCKLVATIRPRVELPGHRIEARIQFIKYHALIGKFIGLWPTENALRTWINTK